MQPTFDELAKKIKLPKEDWQAIAAQAERMAQLIRTLDELPLLGVEPAVVCQLDSRPQRSDS